MSFAALSQESLKRILVIDLRAQRFGFVAFEDVEVIDFGTRYYEGRRSVRLILLKKKIEALLRLFSPEFVIVRTPPRRHSVPLCPAVTLLRTELRKHGIRFKWLKGEQMSRHYLKLGMANKHEIGKFVARHISRLEPLLPPRRKFYKAEHQRVTIFDAAAAGLCFFQMNGPRNGENTSNAYLS